MIPTKVINTKMVNKDDRTGRLVLVNTDAGYFTIAQLAKIIGVSKDGLRGRVERFGWHSQRIWEPLHKECTADDSGNAEWRKLGTKPRDYNMNKVTPVGIYDNLYHVGGCDNLLGA